MITKEFTVNNKLGLHARPAAMFVKTASKFKAKIEVKKEDMVVDGKSIMGLMMLAAESGSILMLTANGDDENEAMDSIARLFEVNFNEE